MGGRGSPKKRAKAHNFFNDAKSGIALSRHLLEHYDWVCQHVAAADNTSRTESSWEDGKKTLQRVLDRQAEKTKLEAHRLLHDSRKSLRETPVDVVFPEEDDDLWEHFAATESMEEGARVNANDVVGWGVAAKRCGKSVYRMVKCLPEDSE